MESFLGLFFTVVLPTLMKYLFMISETVLESVISVSFSEFVTNNSEATFSSHLGTLMLMGMREHLSC